MTGAGDPHLSPIVIEFSPSEGHEHPLGHVARQAGVDLAEDGSGIGLDPGGHPHQATGHRHHQATGESLARDISHDDPCAISGEIDHIVVIASHLLGRLVVTSDLDARDHRQLIG